MTTLLHSSASSGAEAVGAGGSGVTPVVALGVPGWVGTRSQRQSQAAREKRIMSRRSRKNEPDLPLLNEFAANILTKCSKFHKI